MVIAGLVVTLLGFLISVASLTLTDSVGGRMGIVIAGLVISLFGIIGHDQQSLFEESDLEEMRTSES